MADTAWPTDAWGLAAVVHERTVASTMDRAHALAAEGAPAGTLVLADQQTGGRGRGGNRWASEPDAGVWMTLIERPMDGGVVGVLALRLGMALAHALAPLTDDTLRLKWPNDLLALRHENGRTIVGKLAGILVEARWREAAPDWVAIGIGINLRVPQALPDAAALRPGTTRTDVLSALFPAVRRAAAATAMLSDAECAAWQAQDYARGRSVRAPVAGVVQGIAADGALLVAPHDGGPVTRVLAGSLVFDPDHQEA